MALIEDGIVNKEEWLRSSLKVLFLLKEAYGNLGETYSLIKFYTQKEPHWWGKTGKGCKHYIDDLQIKDGDVALVDIIKESGEGVNEHRRTSDSELVDAFEKNRILNQIKEINPDVIICGGTYWVLKEYYPNIFPKVEKGSCFTIKEGVLTGKIIANCYHPSYGSTEGKRNVAKNILRLIENKQ